MSETAVQSRKIRLNTPLISVYSLQPRHLVQIIVLLTTLVIGLQFFIHVEQALGPDDVTVKRPPGVEGFLPIGALMGWKYFLMTGNWESTHPAAMSIFAFALLLSLMLHKAFCGWFCPVGTLSEWAWKLGNTLFGRSFKLPTVLDYPARSLKYILLGFFIWAVGSMDAAAIEAFSQSPYYKLADVKMLFFFTRMTLTTAIILTGLVLLSMLVKNFWCRYLCPYGALLGIVAMVSPTRIKRSQSRCTGCGRCNKACPAMLPISEKKTIASPECSGCMDCTAACPEKEALLFSTRGISGRFWSLGRTAVFVVFLFSFVYFSANLTGLWQGSVSEHEFRIRLKTIDSPMYTHPTF